MISALHDDPATGQDIRVETHCGILDWLQFATTPRRIICRRHHLAPISDTVRATLDVARQYQDEGKLSILTIHRGTEVLFVAERPKCR